LPAAIAVQNARILAQPNSLSENLEKALANRAVIDLTNVILISRSRINYDQAFTRLRTLSQCNHLKGAAVDQRRSGSSTPGRQPTGI